MKPLVALNWKMYRSAAQEIAAARQLVELGNYPATLAVFPSFLSLYSITEQLKGSAIELGAQDCAMAAPGAYTGQVAAQSLVELGCRWCIIGHSERRMYLGETDELVVAKVNQALAARLQPIVCVGETAQERAAGVTLAVVEKMLEPVQGKVGLCIAYEPVWAINSGTTPTAQELERALGHIRKIMGAECRVIYGGSISGATASILKEVPSCQGALVGKASLDVQELKKILESMSN